VGCGESGDVGGGCGCLITRVGWAVCSLNLETEPLGLGYGHAM